jgi:hypothetical protein
MKGDISVKYAKYKDRDKDANSSWFHHCVRTQIPFITIAYRTKLADIEFDYITFNSDSFDEVLRSNEEETYKTVQEIFEHNKNSKSRLSFSWGVIRLTNIEIQKSEKVAEQLFDFIIKILELKTDIKPKDNINSAP